MKLSIILTVVVAATCLSVDSCTGQSQSAQTSNTRTADQPLSPCGTFSADSAFSYIQAQCTFGPRVPASEASALCGDYIVAQFKRHGFAISEQRTNVEVYDGRVIPARNITASLNPDNPHRILFCAHWDSRPWADHDPNPDNHHTPVMGANDGASGVGVMLELARLVQQQPIALGIDFVCFDVEDMGTPEWEKEDYTSRDTWCLGSRVWAEQAAAKGYTARFGVLLDMVGGCGCTFSCEEVSNYYAPERVAQVWNLAKQLGYGQFFPQREGSSIMDDHVNVNRVAGVPCINIVPYFTEGPSGFGPTWHTVNDTPENISKDVLKAVGQTLIQLIYNENEK